MLAVLVSARLGLLHLALTPPLELGHGRWPAAVLLDAAQQRVAQRLLGQRLLHPPRQRIEALPAAVLVGLVVYGPHAVRLSSLDLFAARHAPNGAGRGGRTATYEVPRATGQPLDRFGRGEGFNGQLSTLYKLIENKRWFRRQVQAELDTNIVFAIICSLSLEGLKWERRHDTTRRNAQARQARTMARWLRASGGLGRGA